MFGFTVAVASADRPAHRRPAHRAARRGERLAARSSWSTSRSGSSRWCSILRLVPDNPGGRDAADDTRIDVPGALLLGLAVVVGALPADQPRGRCPAGRCSSLLAFPPLAWAFVRWEQRTVARGHPPLLDVSLLRGLPGYANGLLVGTLYFTGFTGIFLVLSVHLQEGVGFSPLQAALLLTPFAVGAATTSPLAGRLVGRIGRRVTLLALSVMMTGTALAAWLVDLAVRHAVVDAGARRCSSPASAAAG